MDADSSTARPGLQLTLTVWADTGTGWRARAVLADETTRDFESPFELARFLSWPVSAPAEPEVGLR